MATQDDKLNLITMQNQKKKINKELIITKLAKKKSILVFF